MEVKAAGSDGVFAAGVGGLDDEEASGEDAAAWGRHARRETHGTRFFRGLQHRRLFFLGSDCGRACTGARVRAVSGSELSGIDARSAYQHRSRWRVSRVWRAPGGDRAGATL